MSKPSLSVVTLAVAAALGLSACGGSSNSPSNVGTTTEITGVVTGFGSIFVDGVEYETDSASFSLDGVAGSENELAVGMVVTLQGTVNADGTTGVASAVQFADEVEGVLLENNYLLDGTLNIMGQTVHIDPTTAFDSKVATITSVDLVEVGNVIEVSGFSDGNGLIFASRIEVKKQAKDVDDEISMKGIISNLDDVALTFNIGGLSIDYSNAQFDGFNTLSDGLFVEVKSDNALSGMTLVADEIELENDGKKDDDGDDGEEREFEGVIMAYADNMLTVNGQSVYLNDRTEYENGNMNGLVVGTKIKVEAEFDSTGQLIADEIKFKESGNTEVSGVIESIDIEANSVTIMGTSYHLNNNTMIKDERDDNDQTPVRYFKLSDIAAGDWVEVRAGYDDAAMQWNAVKLKRDDMEDGDLAELSGEVSEVNKLVANQLTVAGITVDFTAVVGFSATVGDMVEMEGNYNAGVFTVTKIEIDD